MIIKKTQYIMLALGILANFSCKNQSRSSTQNGEITQPSPARHSQVSPSWKKTRHEKDSDGLTILKEFTWESYRVISHSDGESVDFSIYYRDKSAGTQNAEQQILYIQEDKTSNLQAFDIIDSVLDLQKDGKTDLVACTFSYGNAILAQNYFIELDQGQARIFARINAYNCLEKDKTLINLNADGLFELLLNDMNYGGRFSGDWSDEQGLDIPAPELVFEWNAKSQQYLLSQNLMKLRIPAPEKLATLAGEIRQSPKWQNGVVPFEALQQALALMYAGQEEQGWRFLRDSAPAGTTIPTEVLTTLRRLRDKDFYWKALQSGRAASLDDFKF